MSKILFILKRRENYSEKVDTKIGLTTGLYNSASFVNRMLNKVGIKSTNTESTHVENFIHTQT